MNDQPCPEKTMTQLAPYPRTLEKLVQKVRYRPGWSVELTDTDRGQGSAGLTLIITTQGYDSYHPDRGENYRVHHLFPVPPAAYDERSWMRWLFEQFLLVERHECMEFFQIVHKNGPFALRDGSTSDEYVERPFAPHHGPGNDPYIVFQHGTDEDVRTSFRGVVKDAR